MFMNQRPGLDGLVPLRARAIRNTRLCEASWEVVKSKRATCLHDKAFPSIAAQSGWRLVKVESAASSQSRGITIWFCIAAHPAISRARPQTIVTLEAFFARQLARHFSQNAARAAVVFRLQ